MNEKILTSAGLTFEQAKIYLFLLENGLTPAKIISNKTGIGRALSYKILDQLTKLGLVEERNDVAKIVHFLPSHPQRLKELLDRKKDELDETKKRFDVLYGKMTSDFNMLAGKPNVQFFEGVDGLQRVYSDILENNQDVQIISSPIEEGRAEVLNIIRKQIADQVKQGIKTKAITPLGQQKIATPVEEDTDNLITRKIVPAEKLKIPAQIIVYGDKVAITNFKETTVTVLIESKYMTETFRIIFDYIWNNE